MRSPLLVLLLFATASQVSFADRIAYRGTQELVAHGAELTVRHGHDWSRVTSIGSWKLSVSADSPFGVDLKTSSLTFFRGKEQIARVASPPLTYLEVSADGRFVIGLSNIKLLNLAQLAVYDERGKLLLRRQISAWGYCFEVEDFAALRKRHVEAFREIDAFVAAFQIRSEWYADDAVYLESPRGVSNMYWRPLAEDLAPHRCRSPLSAEFSGSVTNSIRWYHATDPRPRVLEEGGQPVEVRLRDPKGHEFAISFASDSLLTSKPRPQDD